MSLVGVFVAVTNIVFSVGFRRICVYFAKLNYLFRVLIIGFLQIAVMRKLVKCRKCEVSTYYSSISCHKGA